MFPPQFKGLFEVLRAILEPFQSELSKIKEATEKQETATKDATQAAEKQMGKIPGIILPVIEASHLDLVTYINSQREQENAQRRLDSEFQRRILCATWATAIFTGLAFIAAAYYAHVASGQLDETIEATRAAVRAADAAQDSYIATYEKYGAVDRQMGEMRRQTSAQVKAAKAAQDAAEVAKNTLIASQRAFVSIGRKDGKIAEFVRSKDHPDQRAQLVVYFQNAGHIPAKMYWNTPETENNNAFLRSLGITMVVNQSGNPKVTGVPLWPDAVDEKTGGIAQGYGEAIAGDSVRNEPLWDISQPDLDALPGKRQGFYIYGWYAYCDDLGTWSTHHFTLNYRFDVASDLSFSLWEDVEVPNPDVPKQQLGRRYFPPCTSMKVLQRVSEDIARRNGKK